MKIAKFNQLVNLLLIYMVVAILLLGLFGTDIVSDMAIFLFIYGIPLLITIFAYIAFIVIEIRKFIKIKEIDMSQLPLLSCKMLVAVMPMFYLNNTGAHLLSVLRLN